MTTSSKTLRTRNMTAAKRSATLIRDEAIAALATIENNGVPDRNGFRASVAKYEQALTTVAVLDDLAEFTVTEPADDDTVEVQRDALAALIDLLRASEVGYVIQDAEDGSPLGDVLAAVYPDGLGLGEQEASGG